MNILVQLVHPAHFHYYRKTIDDLKQKGHKVVIAITTKDILEKIVKEAGYEYINVMPVSHKSTKIGYLYDMIMRNLRILHLCVKHKIDIKKIRITSNFFIKSPHYNSKKIKK